MNNDPNDRDLELEALRCELRELKEEIKNKQQITSGDIAVGVAGGIMKVIGTFVMLYFVLFFIALFFSAFTSIDKDNSPSPTITLPPS
ncbi:hypothetical protein [Nostoc sp.]|uniref:hypothetical protein n=1 Tax=Nostoc sp. TaxID=1180 RepID=UPI002FF8A65A